MKKTLIILAVAVIAIVIGNSIYMQTNKEEVPGKSKRIACMSKVTSFERGYADQYIKEAQEQLTKGNFILTSGIDKATYMNSTLFDQINMKNLDKQTLVNLNTYIKELKKDINNEIYIEYKVYENDKDDPKKKSSSCKLFRGYIVLKVKNINKKVVYQVQIDFLDPMGKDIEQTIKCAIEAFITYNTK